MFIISNYTINLIGYPGKYHPCEMEAATMGSRLTMPAYYLIVLGARHSVCSQATVEVGWDGPAKQAAGPSNRVNAAARWGRRELERWGHGFPSETPEAFGATPGDDLTALARDPGEAGDFGRRSAEARRARRGGHARRSANRSTSYRLGRGNPL